MIIRKSLCDTEAACSKEQTAPKRRAEQRPAGAVRWEPPCHKKHTRPDRTAAGKPGLATREFNYPASQSVKYKVSQTYLPP